MRKTAVVLGLLFAFSVQAASTPELVRDFLRTSAEPSDSWPEHFFGNGERAFFFADDGQGRELWTSDGTAAGTHLVAELTPGPGPEYLSEEPRFVASGDLVYFLYRGGLAPGIALWRTDGTARGTFPVLADVWWDTAIAPFGERGAIVAMNGLHVTDGETTRLLATDFWSESLVNVNGMVYGIAGDTLWRTDGTQASEVFRLEGNADDEQLVVHGGALYLLVRNDSDAAEVWRSDGTTTARVAALEESDEWPRLLAIEDGVFALVNSGATTHVMRIGANGASLAFAIPGRFRGALAGSSRGFFAFETDDPPRLWRSDGTLAGTRAIVDGEAFYDPAVTRTQVVYDTPSGVYAHDGTSARLLTEHRTAGDLQIAEVGGRFLFAVEEDDHGAEPWVSDGSTAGTSLLKNIHPDHHSEGSLARRVGDAIFFRARSDELGFEPWIIDGNGLRVIDVSTGPTSSDPRLFTEINGRLLFLSNPAPNHPEGFNVTDGNGIHTIRLYDFSAYWDDDFTSFPVAGNRAFLFGWGDGQEVWTTDGTFEGTARGTAVPFVDDDFEPVAANGVVFFVAESDLWRTDGTAAGTYALASGVEQIHATPSRLFFVAHGNAHGRELWVSDGTLGGTHVVKDIRPGRDDAFYGYFDGFAPVFQTLGAGIVFAADDGVHGREPWFSDGTESGTSLLRDVAPGEASSMLPRFDREGTASAGGLAYFVADDGVRGFELWRTDGTASGTVLARDIAPGRVSSTPSRMRAVGDGVYFSADDGVHGRELWWSSLAGTHLVADVAPGTDASQPHDMTELGGWIYFFAMTKETGDELWRVEAPRVRRRAVR